MKNSNQSKVLLTICCDQKLSREYLKRYYSKSLSKLAEINGLFYLYINKLKEYGIKIEDWSSDAKLLIKEEEKLKQFKKTLILLNRISDEYNIDFMIIKMCDRVVHIPRDIDLLVHPKDKSRLCKALESMGMVANYSNNVETSYGKKGFIKIDIYTKIRYISVDFIDETFLWESKRYNKIFGIEYPGLNSGASFQLILVHALFGHRSLTLLDLIQLNFLLKNIKDLRLYSQHAYDRGWGKVFDLSLRKLKHINKKIDECCIDFPYLFDRSFIMKCISLIEKSDMDETTIFFFHISLFIDKFIHFMRRSFIYEVSLRRNLFRKIINNINYFIRSLCKDTKSS